jgi:isopentenyldiphosphate isomerase
MSKNNLQYPLHWNCSVCGFVESGESYEDAAVRGLMEGLGIAKRPNDLEFVSKELVTNKFAHFAKIFMTVHDENMALSKEEIAEGKFFSVREVKKMMAGRNEKFSPFFRNIFEKVFGSDEVKTDKLKIFVNRALPQKRRRTVNRK